MAVASALAGSALLLVLYHPLLLLCLVAAPGCEVRTPLRKGGIAFHHSAAALVAPASHTPDSQPAVRGLWPLMLPWWRVRRGCSATGPVCCITAPSPSSLEALQREQVTAAGTHASRLAEAAQRSPGDGGREGHGSGRSLAMLPLRGRVLLALPSRPARTHHARVLCGILGGAVIHDQPRCHLYCMAHTAQALVLRERHV